MPNLLYNVTKMKTTKTIKKQDISDIPKSYDSDEEPKMYELWEESGYFNPDNMPGDKKTFVVTLPPPNANAKIHVGNTCGYSFQDCMGRYNRMKGRPTLLLPGKDHAGIQTEAVFTKELDKKGINKWDLGREKFYEMAYEFCLNNAKYARDQEKRLGLSADWSREKFTLDPKLTEVIYETFYKLYQDKLIYRGKYIINRCTYCRTALADVDTEHVEMPGIFAYIKYPISGKEGKFITVATTRPETMLGDTAVAVNPDDERYKDMIGWTVDLPLTDRKIPIIAEPSVDMELGTGALKITPAHSAVDFEIGERHKLPVLNVIDEIGRMNENAPEKYRGMKTKDARDAVLADLKELGLLEKVENINHEVITCERCHHAIEQIVSTQWFLNVKPLAEKAIEALDKGETKVIPDHKHKVLRRFFEEIRPWCISRQLWWGQRIPVWYCGSRDLHDWLLDHPGKIAADYEKSTGKKSEGCGEIVIGAQTPKKCPKCNGAKLQPEEDVFDTWFSSGQWPFSTLGGPESEDFKKYYPTDVMETMYDILFWWVARMMMLGIYRTGKSPFHTVYLHGMILAPNGQKMSKSKGNLVAPDELFARFGADSVRLWYFTDSLPAQATPVREEKLKGNRNFVNKIWNASRYVMMQLGDLDKSQIEELDKLISVKIKGLSESKDKWESATFESAKEVTRHLDKYKFNLAIEELREFFWHTFCDQWIEETKKLITEDESQKMELLARLIAILAIEMTLLHPFAPFVTEKVWQSLQGLGLLTNESELLMMQKWPVE